MKVLVTGATGFLGSHLCRTLVRAGHQVTAMKRLTSDISPLDGLPVDYCIADLLELDSLSAAVAGQEVIIHAAADLAAWSQSEDVQGQVNVQGTQALLAACRQTGVQRFIYVSSVAAIGTPADCHQPADERMVFNMERMGINYPLTKRRAEAAVLTAHKQGLDAVIVNPGTIFGPFGRRYRGSDFFRKVQQRRVAFYYMGGRNIVHVEDVTDGILRALQAGRSGERYILGGDNLTYRQIVEVTARELGVRRLVLPVYPAVTGIASVGFGLLGKITGRRPRISRADHFYARRCMFFSSEKAGIELGYRSRPFLQILCEYLAR